MTSLDGVVSYQTPDAMGGGEISGFFEPDRFVMGVLRATRRRRDGGCGHDARDAHAPLGRRSTSAAHSRLTFAELRARLGLQPQPLTAIVSASGEVDLAHPGLSATRRCRP